MALAGFSRMGSLANRMLRRRPLAPLAVSRADGSGAAVKPPTQSRAPMGTMFSPVQRFGVPSSAMVRALQPKPAAPAAAPAPAPRPSTPGAPAAAPLPAPNIAPKARPTLPGPGGTGRGDFGPGGNIFDAPDPGRGTIGPGGFVPHQAGTLAGVQIGGTRTEPTYTRPGTPGAPAAAPATPPFAANISDITGQERPQAITPGQSVTQPLQEQAQAAASRALESPSPFDDELFKQEVARGREAFGGDIAERGLDYSTIAPTLFAERVINPLLSERARGIAGAREQALRGAQDVIGQRTGLEAQGRGELRGERGYTDELRERARRNEIERYQLEEGQFQGTLQQALASGDPSRALAALQSAAYGMGQPAQAYGQQAEQSGAGLQDLAELFMNQFYGNRGQPEQRGNRTQSQ